MDDARQMSAFVAVADELHLGRAADRLGVHPATVAARLRALESRVGLVLVDRSHRSRIAVTQAGAALLPDARGAVEAMATFDERCSEVRAGTRGVVRVALTSEADDRTAALIDELRRVDRGWKVSVERVGVEAAGRALAVGAVECSIGEGRLAPRTVPDTFDRRPNRLETALVARIRPRSVDADEDLRPRTEGRAGAGGIAEVGAGPGGDTDAAAWRGLAGNGLVVAWRRRWEDSGAPHAATLVARVRHLRLIAGGRRAAAALARRRAAAKRRRAVDAERRLIVEETARYGFTEAAARAAVRNRARVLRRVADARDRGEPLGLHLTIEWLCLLAQDERDGSPPPE